MKYYYIPLESKTTFQSFVTGSEFAMYDTTSKKNMYLFWYFFHLFERFLVGNKKETISSAKRLLLWHKSLKCVFETDSQKVREILDLSTTAKSVKISAKELPGNNRCDSLSSFFKPMIKVICSCFVSRRLLIVVLKLLLC